VNDVLTTAKAADLLGVSVRTAQLWVESGRLPSWKTPGGHRRIPRQAVLGLIDKRETADIGMRAYAMILAGEGRAAKWREIGLHGSGLLLEVTESLPLFRSRLAFAPPMLVIVESADERERRRLLASLANDPRYRETTLISVNAGGAEIPVTLDAHRAQIQQSPDVAATSDAIMSYLQAKGEAFAAPAPFLRPWNDLARSEAVKRTGLLDSTADAHFEGLVRVAAKATQAPMAMFTLITRDEQWLKARTGYEGATTARDWAFCNETLFANAFTVFEDLSNAAQFAGNPTLAKPYGFRFYAGAPVRDPDGFALGSICIIDVVPRKLSEDESDTLTTLAEAASNLIALKARDAAGLRLATA
jgi:excisionase family DNA binding protein